MADQKISEFAELTTGSAGEDLITIVDDPNGTPVNKKITVKNLFGKVPANTIINGTFVANTDIIRVSTSKTPANSTSTAIGGSIFWDSDYIYIAVSNNVIKRTALSSF
jgi:hypothetical protein